MLQRASSLAWWTLWWSAWDLHTLSWASLVTSSTTSSRESHVLQQASKRCCCWTGQLHEAQSSRDLDDLCT